MSLLKNFIKFAKKLVTCPVPSVVTVTCRIMEFSVIFSRDVFTFSLYYWCLPFSLLSKKLLLAFFIIILI